jgi:hypothetical protein
MRLVTDYYLLCAGAAQQEVLASDHARPKQTTANGRWANIIVI